MRIQTKGKTGLNNVQAMIKAIVENTLEKANLDANIEYKVENFTTDIVFNINGEEQKIIVNHGGLDEIFTVAVGLDSSGTIIKSADNLKESFIDEYVRQEMTGQVKEYDTIESEFTPEELKEMDVNDLGNVKEIVYEIIATGEKLLQYYKDDKLVGEVVLEK